MFIDANLNPRSCSADTVRVHASNVGLDYADQSVDLTGIWSDDLTPLQVHKKLTRWIEVLGADLSDLSEIFGRYDEEDGVVKDEDGGEDDDD
jgi:hypothetical protein